MDMGFVQLGRTPASGAHRDPGVAHGLVEHRLDQRLSVQVLRQLKIVLSIIP
jgi:hypothetical protein